MISSHSGNEFNTHLTILVPPRSVQHGARANVKGGRFFGYYNDPDKRKYLDSIIAEVEHQAPMEPLLGPIVVDYVFHLAVPENWVRSGLAWDSNGQDHDNLTKSVQDALSKAGFWKNDSQICMSSAAKYWVEPDMPPRIEVSITRLPYSKTETPRKTKQHGKKIKVKEIQ